MTPHRRTACRGVTAALLAAGLCTCSSAGTSSGPASALGGSPTAPRASAAPAVPSVAPGSAAATTVPSTAPRATLSACGPPVTLASLAALVRIPSADIDDVTVTSDGHLWVTAVTAGKILELAPTGTVLRTISDPRGPEGIVQLPGGALAVAEQRSNRVASLDPVTGALTSLLAVPNHTANEGVDGLGIDVAGSRLLVPDSANGRLLALPLTATGTAAGPAAVVAGGLGRPVAAWAEAGGTIVVAEENAPGLVRVDASGAVTPIAPAAGFSQLDEVIGRNGLLYVTDLATRRLEALDPATGTVAVLVSASPMPQGLALLPDGRLLLIDSQTRELAAVPSCG